MYTNGELQEIARFANSSQILEIIFQYVKYNIGKVCGYGILCCMARNPVAKSELLDELYLFDQRLAYQIFNNHEGKASTELLIQMFNECEENLRGLHLVQLVQFDRKEINELIYPKLPLTYSEEGKYRKVQYLLTRLRKKGIIINMGSDTKPIWKLK